MTKENVINLNFSPSSSYKWLRCPASIIKEQKITHNLISQNRKEGQIIHKQAESLLKCLYSNNFVKNNKYYMLLADINDTHIQQYLNDYINYIQNIINDKSNIQVYIEYKINVDTLIVNCFGAIDCAIIEYNNHICHILDLKTSSNYIDVFENSQLKLYALGMMHKFNLYNFKTFRLHIFQPKINNIRYFDIDTKTLMDFAVYCNKKASNAMSATPEVVADIAHCKYCKAQGVCKKYDELFNKLIHQQKIDI